MTKLVCAWCSTRIGNPGSSRMLDSDVSHGLCSECADSLSRQHNGLSLQRQIDNILIPILLIDGQNTVSGMNAKACETLGWESPFKQALGLVFDCVYAGLPGGCVRSIHCSGCAIRKAVETTFKTGKPQIDIPATLSVDNLDEIADVAFAITTVKRDGVVLLRVKDCRTS